ncbi:MAG TPA: HIT domain-containing protein [Actinophytocola sp.]|jgi:histidine triad (HIT) family protein|nr:HIT domain-containing protein [Actinophytocola sp.]
MTTPCVFCEIVAGRAPADVVEEWPEAVAFRPLNPVTDGHMLVVPRVHVADATVRPLVTGLVMTRASQVAAALRRAGLADGVNVITSAGSAATQTVFHLHIHVVPRFARDGLCLPWTGQQAGGETR